MKEAHRIKSEIDAAYAGLAPVVADLSAYIYNNPETAFQEYKAAEKLTSALSAEGFSVMREAGGLETAFRATFDNAKADDDAIRIGIVAEYDALPGLGHACGHNVIAASAFGAAVLLKRAMQSEHIPGVVSVIGTPAEEDGGGKIILAERGVFAGLSVCFMMHPTSGKTRIAGKCLSSREMNLSWKGVSAHAEAHPENGVNALDALHVYYAAVACLRQQLPPDVRIAQVVANGGTDVGMIPDLASLKADIVSEDENLIPTTEKMKNCARGAALATGTEVVIEERAGYRGRLPNKTLGDVFKMNLGILGEPVMDGMPPDFGTTDFGDVTRLMPCCNPYVSLLPERKISNHTEEFRELAISERSVKVTEIAAKVMAYSAVDLLLDRTIVSAAQEEFERSV
ncbi:MAG: M20 family metallopeptidase [Clostridiales Family XIII bacterium]|jgi:amidohydrolase|nr:M20 family metallopeptidase [Clostridiales Family XIII bacterium]